MNPEVSKEPVQKPANEGSWLTYVVVVFVLIFVLGLLFAPNVTDHGIPAAKMKAYAMEGELSTACQAYMTEYKLLPPTAENYRLVKILMEDNPRKILFINLKSHDLNANGEFVDPWKTPYRITFDSDSKVHVISAGPDKLFGTPDDISNQ